MAGNYKRGEFCNYLQRYKVEKMSVFTHTSIVKPSGAFYIPTDEMELFFQMYTRAMAAGEDIYMTEKHRDIAPFLIDLDFRFEKTDNMKRRYTLDNVKQIISIYMSCIKEYIVIPETITIYILEKPYLTTDKGLIKDGIHIIIPEVVTKPSVQYLVRKQVIPQLKSLFESFNCVNDVEDIIDEAVIERNNWQMYGSKKPNCEPYEVTNIFMFRPDDNSLTEKEVEANKTQYVEILSIRNKYDAVDIKIDKHNTVIEFEQELQSKKRKNMQNNPALQSSRNNKKNVIENIEHVEKMIEILSEERANSYHDWIRVGWCLRNIDYRLLPKWIEFSKKSSKFVDGECDRYWNHMKDDGLGIGTLYMWAKQDNPEGYKEIMENDISNLIYTSRNETHYDVARVVHFMFKHEFVCASIKQNYWYQFREHRWVPCDCGYTLNHKLSTDVFKQYNLASSKYSMRAAQTDDESEQSRFADTSKKLTGIAQKLKQVAFKENVMTECRRLFYAEKFDEKLDSRCNLIGFENGVYDLEQKEFREGRPEDFISFTTGCNYVQYEADNPFSRQIDNFMSQVLPKSHMKEYVLLLLASFLDGNIREERFHIWTGTGCFAKDTPIMMYDGSSKAVQDVQVGDALMGDDSTPRNVQQLFRGYSDMYDIIPVKGEKFTVNGQHDLVVMASNMTLIRNRRDYWEAIWVTQQTHRDTVLKNNHKAFSTREAAIAYLEEVQTQPSTVKKGDIMIMNVHQYLNLPRRLKEALNMYRPEMVHYNEQAVDVDPWFLGYWLGNGHSCHTSITTMYQEVVDETKRIYDDTYDIHVSDEKNQSLATTWSICKKNGECLYNKFVELGVIKNKHIPTKYLHNTKDLRMKLLAGIVDSDGHYQEKANHFEVTFENEQLLDDTITLARSLGFTCYKYAKTGTWTHNGVKKYGTYYRTHICGHGLENIPTVVKKKQAKARTDTRNPLIFSFKVQRVDDGNFYGFELDGNRRFLKGNGDFTVLKNSNGKSKLIDLFEQSFGDYCCKFPVTLLTQKRAAAGSATSELARAKGKRFSVLQEPSEDEKLNVGLMKELSGGDKIQARALFKEPIEFKPQFKMVLTCNHLPNVPSDDGGTWRRIRLVEFTSKFTHNPNPENANEFPIDVDLSSKFIDWREHFMALLIEFYKKYCAQGGIKEPEEVLACTREYQRNNDFYLEFVENELEKDDMAFLSVNDAYTVFKQWLRDNMPSFKIKKKEFLIGVDKNCGKRVNFNKVEGWKGYKIRSMCGFSGGDQDDPLA